MNKFLIKHILREGLNIPKMTPVSFAKNTINKLVVRVENPDTHNPNYISYFDVNDNLIMDENQKNGWFAISSEKIYHPIHHQFPQLNHNYETIAPIIQQALEEILKKDIGFIHNVSKIETQHHRRGRY